MFQSLRSKTRKFALVAPVAIVALVVAACSPGSAQTTAPIYDSVTGNYLKVSAQCLNQGGLCAGIVSLTFANGGHFLSSTTGAGFGFQDLNGDDCTAAPCAEGGEAGLGGNGSYYPTLYSKPQLVSYYLDGFDYDNANGTQSAPDSVTLKICSQPFTGYLCGTPIVGPTAFFSETFTCTDQGLHSCFEVTLRPGSFLLTAPVRH